jgi:fibronectin-binding autotransporter adhesin
MRPRTNRTLPQAFIACAAPLLTFTSASADVIVFNEANATNVWTVPGGTNLLNGATASPATANVHEGSSSSWTTLTDGILGAPGTSASTVTPNNGDSVTFPLDTVAQPEGYDITSFDSYVTWGDSGRTNQNYTLQYSTVSEPGTFLDIAVVANGDSGADKATHTRLTDTTGVLATGVHSVRILFGTPNGQENGYVGFSELKLLASPTRIETLRESNTGNVWTLPAGTNLLDGAAAIPATTNTNEGSSPNWTTVTNGALGTAADISSSVTPPNNTSVIFPLDLSVNFNGYRLTSFDSYCAWPNSGRDNQHFAISYSTVADPATFIPLASAVVNTTGDNATHARITPLTGALANGVAAIKLSFGHQENGFVGYREFIALGTAESLTDPLTWTGGSGSGGNANWIAGPDNNWKETIGGAPANFDPLAELTFDSTGTNRNIALPSALTASSLTIANTAATSYTFGGQLLTVSNGIASTGSGGATFSNAVNAAGGASLSGTGSLTFNDALAGSGLTVAGTGIVNLNGANPDLTGSASVSSGALQVGHDGALQNAAVVTTGGVVRFLTAAPQIASLSGTPGTSVVLGNSVGPVNTTLSVGDDNPATSTIFEGDISPVAGRTSSLTKTGPGSLTLSGVNTYTGTTTVAGGTLELTQPLSLYNGNNASWTAGNLVVQDGGTMLFEVGFFDEFTETDLNDNIALGGFQSGATLGIDNTDPITLSRNLTQPGLGLLKTGTGALFLTGNNTSNGLTKIFDGSVTAGSLSGTGIGGSVHLGNGSAHVFLNFSESDQLGAGAVISASNGNFYQSKINLRGTDQTVSGLEVAPLPVNRVTLIQNDENTLPDYGGVPAPASLTINATDDHSFAGIIRDGDGGNVVSVVKNGPGTQEFRNLSGIQGFGYTGLTSLNEGTLRINFGGGNTGFGSNIEIAEPATLNFHAVGGNYAFGPAISGLGKVVVDGTNAVVLTNGANSWSGGTTVDGGFLALAGNGSAGEGTGPGQTSVGGAMDPANLIAVTNIATLSLDGIAPLGNSNMLPEFAPSIRIDEGSKIYGGTNTVAFVPNVTLDGGEIEITNGATHGGFNTNIALVGTVIVGGSSSVPSEIHTTGTGDNANVSLGSVGVPGTEFQVADVTGEGAADLTVSSVLRDIGNVPSALTKSGPGTMSLLGGKSYTGTTHVVEGILLLDTPYLADNSTVDIETTGTLDLQFTGTDTIGALTLGGTPFASGTFAAIGNGGPGITETARITGTGRLSIAVAVSYETWAAVIPNPDDRDRTDDPDGDGFSNLDEFLFGTSPVNGTGSLARIEDTGSGLIVRWNQRAAGTSVYVLQESTTLLDNPWPTSAATITDDPVQDIPDYVRKQAVIPVSGARKFVRIQATE